MDVATRESVDEDIAPWEARVEEEADTDHTVILDNKTEGEGGTRRTRVGASAILKKLLLWSRT